MPASARFVFDTFELDPTRRRLSSAGEPVALPARQIDILLLLVSRTGQIVSKEDLLQAGWNDVAVGDNSLEQAIASLRKVLGAHPSGTPYIETIPRRGYRFGVDVSRHAPRETDAGLDELLAPLRAFVEGRAALETLEPEQIARAREVFEHALLKVPEHAAAHVGLANACFMRFETTRADAAPDIAALATAAHHAREACRLDPPFAEAWATLGLILERTGDRVDALAASKRAVMLEPDNWQHHVRLAYVGWGEERLRAARRTLALLPNLPIAHWLTATVYVARQLFDEAERELTAAVAFESEAGRTDGRFSTVAVHWLRGLLCLARGDEAGAIEQFELELAREQRASMYSRECCANTWYAVGAVRLRNGEREKAGAAFQEALARVSIHPMARVGLGATGLAEAPASPQRASNDPMPNASGHAFEIAAVRAAQLVLTGAHGQAAVIIDAALADAPPGNAGWWLPVEPLLRVAADPGAWAGPLARLSARAA